MNAFMKIFVALVVVTSSTFALGGRVGGGVVHDARVPARSVDVYNETFRGGQPAMVLVRGDGDTDLDVFVYDQFGYLVASDTDATDSCIVQWIPPRTGNFTIRVVNHGEVYNRYRLLAN